MVKNVKDILLDDFWIMPATPEYLEAGVPYITSKNIKNGKIDFSKTNYISQEAYETISKNRPILEGDILISMIGTLGETAEVTKEDGAFYGQNMFLIRLNETEINKRYFLNFFKSDFVKRALAGKQNQSTQKYLKANHIEDLQIPVLPLDEQQIIAETLDKIQGIINNRKEELLRLDELIKARFVELFGDPFNNKKWDTQKLRNISVSISDGSNVDKTYYEDKGDVLFLRIQNVWFNEFRLDDSVYISEDVNNEYLDTSLHHGDLLITKIGRYYTKDSSLGRVSVYLGEDDKANYSNNIMRVRLTDEVCSEFVNILMNLDDYNRYIREVSVGGTDKRALSKAIIGDLPIIMPPKELQFEFLEFVRQTDKSKVEVQKALNKAQMLFDSLMQQYFG